MHGDGDRHAPGLLTQAAAQAMPRAPRRLSRVALAGFIFAAWTLPGLLYTLQVHEIGRAEGSGVTILDAALHALPVWWIWAAITPAVTRLVRRAAIRGDRRAQTVALHLAASLLTAAVVVVLASLWFSMTAPFDSRLRGWTHWMWSLVNSTTLHLYVFSYWLILGAVHVFDSERRLQQQQVEAARREAEVVRAQMHLLNQQLQPHFLFNALNGLSTLILRQDPAAAQRMVASLAGYLRAILRADRDHLTPLRAEVDLLEKYLDVEQARWGDRLVVAWEIAPGCDDVLVPALLLQPLVENAIRHGVAVSPNGGSVAISAALASGRLRVEVLNDGPGLAGDWQDRAASRIGLSNTRRRLQALYGHDHDLVIGELEDGRVMAAVEIPAWYAASSARDDVPDGIPPPVRAGSPP